MAETRHPIITLTTDFGTSDPYVASVKAAILAVTSQVHIVDVTHDIPPYDAVAAAFAVRAASLDFPARTIHVVVVDPGVGTDRRPLIVTSENQYFVGPDNGVFSLVLEADPTAKAYHVTAVHYFREQPAPTFHGRDVFGPVAGQLARGIPVENFGDYVEDVVRLDLPKPKVGADGSVRASVLYVDRFGNVITNLTRASIEALLQKLGRASIRGAGAAAAVVETRSTYGAGAAGTPFFLYNSSRHLEIAVQRGRAADALKLKVGDPVDLTLV